MPSSPPTERSPLLGRSPPRQIPGRPRRLSHRARRLSYTEPQQPDYVGRGDSDSESSESEDDEETVAGDEGVVADRSEQQPVEQATAKSAADLEAGLEKMEAIGTARAIVVMAGLCTCAFLSAIAATLVATLQASIGASFNATELGHCLGTSFMLSTLFFSPISAKLSDVFGRRIAILSALVLFGVGTLLSALAPTMGTLIAARALSGLGGGAMQTVSSIIVSDLVPMHQRGLFQGLNSLARSIGTAIGAPIGGILADAFGWRSAFYAQLPLFLICYISVSPNTRFLPRPPPSSLRTKLASIDFLGAFLLLAGLSALVLGLSNKTALELPWGHSAVAGLLGAAPVALALFVWVEACWAKEPILPLRLLKNMDITLISISNLLMFMGWFAVTYNFPLEFIAVRLTSQTEAGAHMLPNSVAVSTGSLFAGWVIARTLRYKPLSVGLSIFPIVSAALIANWTERTGSFQSWANIALGGFAQAAIANSTLIGLLSSVDKSDLATITGHSFLFRTLGSLLGVSLSSALLQDVLAKRLAVYITGPDAADIVDRVRRSVKAIHHLPPSLRAACTAAYADALRVVFISIAAVGVVSLVLLLPIRENPLVTKGRKKGRAQQQQQQQRQGGNADGRTA